MFDSHRRPCAPSAAALEPLESRRLLADFAATINFQPEEVGSVEFAKLLVEEADVAVSPGLGFGEYGEGFVRIALVENEQRIRQAARNIRRFLDTGLEKLHNVVPLATRR